MSRYEASNDRLGILHGMTMGEEPPDTAQSPPPAKRQKSAHSESSHNRSERKRSPAAKDKEESEYNSSKKTKFRFKSKHRRRDREAHGRDHHHHHSSRSNHHRSSKRHHHSQSSYHEPLRDDPTEYDDTYIPNMASWKYAEDQDAAFRESLFDAMADDEGAAFWEAIYGQPVHIYERPTKEDEKGHLEAMTDEEYAQYVREKMWEKSHQHIREERERRAKAKDRDRKRAEEERVAWEEEDRRHRRREAELECERAVYKLRQRWKKYLASWKEQMETGDADKIPWPVASGKRADVTKETVEEFMLGTPLPAERERNLEMVELLKTERVRWHPDKAQQRWGRDGGLDEDRMRAITVCFQTIDRLHAEWKAKT